MAGNKKPKRIDKDTLNLVIASCAVLISAASFYAAYVQSVAAEKQVVAETWPYLQIDHGNFDTETQAHRLDYKLVNAGVGPAHLKSLQLFYEGKSIGGFADLFNACCLKEGDTNSYLTRALDRVVTGNPPPLILPVSEKMTIFTLPKTDENAEVWERLNQARWQITAKACYCSLLGDCYETDFNADPTPVKMCGSEKSVDFTR